MQQGRPPEHGAAVTRGRAWRRNKTAAKEATHTRNEKIREMKDRKERNTFAFHGEKRWKDIVGRSTKVRRGRQLGFDYPRKTHRQILDEHSGADE